MPREDRYTIDLDWAWGPANRDLDGVATLRATIADPESDLAARKVEAWLATIPLGDGESRWSGGWAVTVKSRSATHVIVELVSGGQDVAESLADAVASLQDAVLGQGTTIDWAPQPIGRRTR